jgi:hypothetical protein
MDLAPHLDHLRGQLAVAAEAGGDDTREVAERLLAGLDAAFRLALQDALAAAAAEITADLAPGSVELRLRGRDLEFVVTAPPSERGASESADDARGPDDRDPWDAAAGATGPGDDDDAIARINLRLPEQLKGRVERAAAADGLSVNAWLVRATTAALQRADPSRRPDRRVAQGSQRFTGWAR